MVQPSESHFNSHNFGVESLVASNFNDRGADAIDNVANAS